jgi:hypothetical protein
MMIDTVRVVIPVAWPSPIFGGQVISTRIDQYGEEVRDYHVLKHLGCEGSFSSNLQIRCIEVMSLKFTDRYQNGLPVITCSVAATCSGSFVLFWIASQRVRWR